jgi:hypothetical protein
MYSSRATFAEAYALKHHLASSAAFYDKRFTAADAADLKFTFFGKS